MAQLRGILSAKHKFRPNNPGSSSGDGPPLGFIDLKPSGKVMSHTASTGDGQISRVHNMDQVGVDPARKFIPDQFN
jgi:hypothetical protein